jgi:2-aminoethylphosphonate-pyruvate transaminase
VKAPWTSRPLFNPGPVGLAPAVRDAQCWPEISHRDRRFEDVLAHVRDDLADVYATTARQHALLFAGSGTAAVEAMLLSATADGSHTLVLDNGHYGARMADMLSRSQRPCTRLSRPWGEPFDVAGIASAAAAAGARRIAMVHHETSTASLNELEPVLHVCRDLGLELVLDSVSSFGGEQLVVPDDVPVWMSTCSNKCLEAPPGIAICLVPTTWDPRAAVLPVPLVLDLALHLQAQVGSGSVAFTIPTQLVGALHVALRDLTAEGGWQGRHRRYALRSERVRRAFAELSAERPTGFDTPEAAALSVLRLPPGVSAPGFIQQMYERGITVYGAQGPLAADHIRIAVMGALTEGDVGQLLAVAYDVLAASNFGGSG